jgi:hypothetical protein
MGREITYEDTGGSAANIQASDQVAQQIGSFVRTLSQLTNANRVFQRYSRFSVRREDRQGVESASLLQ